MFDTIVWATDGSELADSTLPLVTELAGIHGSKVVAVHVNELFRGGRLGGGPVFPDEDEIQRKIATQVGEMLEAGLEVELEVVATRRHDIDGLIADTAATVGADLIVIGTHGRSMPATVLLGSVTAGLNHRAPCPVLAVPPLRERVASTATESRLAAAL